ncbi:MAG: PDZ domain-containing protein [Puia sp.]|nr:PDZ domain-containing protein [Puia sp.]
MRKFFFVLFFCAWLRDAGAQQDASAGRSVDGGMAALSRRSVYYVSPGGDDRNPGSLAAPLLTPGEALRRVVSSPGKGAGILLRAGTYRLDTTLVITPAVLGGHRLYIGPYKNERVTISGTRLLKPRWAPWRNGILRAAIGKGLSPDQLYCNGRLLHMARYPNFDSTQRVFDGTAADAISKERVSRWAHPAGGYVHALHQGEWGGFHYRITGVDTGGALRLEGGWQNNRPAPMHTQYRFVENVFEELDTAGEWFYNAEEGNLYVYPYGGTHSATAVWEYSVLDQLIAIRGRDQGASKGAGVGVDKEPVRDVEIRGLDFRGTNRTFMQTREPILRSDWTLYRGGAVFVQGGERIRIAGCSFEGLGGNAVFISNYNRHVSITGNLIDHIGAGAIDFVGNPDAVRSPSFQYGQSVPEDQLDREPGPKSDDYPADCRAYDNLIHDIGRVEKQVAGVGIDMASGIRVSHNTIYNVPRAGINIGDGCWGGHVIEYNDVFNTVLETGDHGAFNSWGRDRYWLPDGHRVDSLTEVEPGKPFWDVVKPITLRNNRWHCTHGWDIDLDDGSSNYRIYDNVCLNGGLKLREGFGRVAENNILVNNSFHPHVWFKKSGDVFRHNIVFADYAPIGIDVWGKEVDSNFFLMGSSLEAARKNGTDMHSISGDPLFVNAAAGNFAVAARSPALRVGFRNFPMDRFGVVSPSLKRLAARPPMSDMRILQGTRKGETVEWMGATIKNIEGLGERSAAGLFDENGVLLVKVPDGSRAALARLKKGDVIRSVNGKPVNTVKELLAVLQAVNWQGKAGLTIIRNQQEQALELPLK